MGGWLVLEPWITPSLFAGTNAPDEFTYSDTASSLRFHRLSIHRKTFVSRRDFQWLSEQGIQAVRIPVGHWIFGDGQPYVGGIEYLDKAFGWAEEFGISVLVCLHGAPGSQNGEMHSGKCGDIGWHTGQHNIGKSLAVVGRLAGRYAGRAGLLGIELLNEPSKTIPKHVLKSYYKQGYKLIRKICGPKVWVVFSDCFQLRRWAWSLHWPFYRNAYLDNHQYQMFKPEDKALDIDGHLEKTKQVAKLLRWTAWHRKVIVGEWSAALDQQSLAGLDSRQIAQAYKAYRQAQLLAYGKTDAWFYWTYKTEAGGPWNFREM